MSDTTRQMDRQARVYVAGAETLIGAAIVQELQRQGFGNLLGLAETGPDLLDPRAVEAFFASQRPEYVFVASGRSGGIDLNQRQPASLMRDNLLGSANIIHAAHQHCTRKLLYLGSSCCYPRLCPQPMREDDLFTGPLEPTNQGYAMAKLAGITFCQAYRQEHGDDFICGLPANCFGPGDDFSQENSHVIAALIRRMHAAKQAGEAEVLIWGSGAPRREFIFADDLAAACLFVMENYSAPQPLNLGGGQDLSIAQLAEMVRQVTGYSGRLTFDSTRPDGMPRKALDASRLLGLGWRPQWDFRRALELTYAWYLEQENGLS